MGKLDDSKLPPGTESPEEREERHIRERGYRITTYVGDGGINPRPEEENGLKWGKAAAAKGDSYVCESESKRSS